MKHRNEKSELAQSTCDVARSGYGGYVNGVYYFTDSQYARLNAGVQGNVLLLGGKAGLTFLSGSTGARDAAIHAFAVLARKLIAIGAPPALVRAALVAAAEESQHAAACLGMAFRYDGRAWNLPSLPIDADQSRDHDVRELVRESWVDGCIGEGLAAQMAHARATVCSRNRGRDVLCSIAREERCHADLGFAVLRFLLTRGGSGGALARNEFAMLPRHSHAPAFVHRHDEPCEWVEGKADARLGPTFDRIVERGHALLRAFDPGLSAAA